MCFKAARYTGPFEANTRGVTFRPRLKIPVAKKRKTTPAKHAASAKTTAVPPAVDWQKYLPLFLIFAVLLCYWTPLTSSNASIQWDAADEFQPGQQYLSDELYAGRVPFWTPFLWAGFPFLADPQLGAWYPLNWPFLIIGPSPRVFEAENLLHALLACFGAYLLAKRLFANRAAAVFAGLAYGLSGFFAGHGSHTPMFQAAAWLPWLQLLFLRALDDRAARYGTLATLVAAAIILAGHFQTALYCFAGLGLFAATRIVTEPRRWLRIAGLAAVIPIGGTLLSAVGTAPGLELVVYSIRTTLAATARHEGFLSVGSLVTLVYPNFYGALTGSYSGPGDITQYYFYAGILLLPLAIAGLRNLTARRLAISLIVPCLWYAAGSRLGLYELIARLPGFSSVRAPIHIWFVPALGLALAGAAGFAWMVTRWPRPWLVAVILLSTTADLWYWNSDNNPLSYGHSSYEATYGAGYQLFERAVASSQPPLTRFAAPERLPTFGPMNHPLLARVEATYGYNPLMLSSYSDYASAMQANPLLTNGLNAARVLDRQRGAVVANPAALPRVNVPRELTAVSGPDESRRLLATLDPAQKALVPSKVAGLRQDPQASAQVLEYSGDRYRIHYRCPTETLLRVSAAYFPGWRARIDGRELEVHTVDHALMGVVVPAGDRDLVLEYHSRYFVAGLMISLTALLACAAILAKDRLFSKA